MKKLMIAAAIASAAALAQASAFDWNSSANVYGIDAAEFTAGLVNGKTYTAGSTSMKKNGTDSGVVWKMVLSITDANGTETLDPAAITGYATTSKPKVNDTLSSNKIANGTEEKSVAVSFSVIYEGTWEDKSGNVWTIKSSPIAADEATFGAYDELRLVTTRAPTSWTATTSAVPEPTSGLLLLLGVAGLALRRRRA